MRLRALALVGVGVLAALAVGAQEVSDRSVSSWAAPPYWLPTGVMPAASSEAAEVEQEAAEPVVVQALPLVAMPPCRLFDTQEAGHSALLAGVGQEIAVVGKCGIPAQAQGVSLRLVVAESSGGGPVILRVAGESGTGAGRLVLDPGEARSTTGVVGLGTSGRLLATTEADSVHVVVEVNGYYAAEPAVRSLNALAGDVTLQAGENIEITTEGSVVTIAVGGSPPREGERPGERGEPMPGVGAPVRRLVQVPANQPTRALPPVKAMAPPSSSMYVAGALGLPDTTALGAGVLTLGGDRFLHNYGSANTFLGVNAGNLTMTGGANTASGTYSLYSNTAGYYNTASGAMSLYLNTEGVENTATGYGSLLSNTTGYSNTASGYECLYSNTDGFRNTASGYQSLRANTIGYRNVAVGSTAGLYNTWGWRNTFIGVAAGVGNTTGGQNTFLGAYSDASANDLTNATAVGYGAIVNASNKVRIGNSIVTVIEGQVDWSFPSDIRHKKDVQELLLGLDFIRQLRPVVYRLKSGNDRLDMGFIAQDIEAVLGDGYNILGIGEDPERLLSLRRGELIAPLVKAVQEQQELIEAQQSEIDGLKARLAEQKQQLQVLMEEHLAVSAKSPGRI